jgi:hypothetical protein
MLLNTIHDLQHKNNEIYSLITKDKLSYIVLIISYPTHEFEHTYIYKPNVMVERLTRLLRIAGSNHQDRLS